MREDDVKVERAIAEADQAAEIVAAKYERLPEYENSPDLNRAVWVLRNPDEVYEFILQAGFTPMMASAPADIWDAWSRQKDARDARIDAPLVRIGD